MTDVGLLISLAEGVMGWKTELRPGTGNCIAVNGDERYWLYGPGNSTIRRWNPLISDADAFMLVDALIAAGYGLEMHAGVGSADVEFYCVLGPCERHGNQLTDRGHGSGGIADPDRRRAICLAAWKTVEGAKLAKAEAGE